MVILVQWQTTDSSNSVRVRVRFLRFFTFLSFYLLTSDLTGRKPADLWSSLLLQLCSLVRVNQEGHHTSRASLVSETRDNGVGCHGTETTCVTEGDRVMCRHEVFKTCVSPQGFNWSLYVEDLRHLPYKGRRELHQGGLGT